MPGVLLGILLSILLAVLSSVLLVVLIVILLAVLLILLRAVGCIVWGVGLRGICCKVERSSTSLGSNTAWWTTWPRRTAGSTSGC